MAIQEKRPLTVGNYPRFFSRFEGLRRYQLLFSISPHLGRFFFDPLRDTLYFGARGRIAASASQLDTFVSLVPPEELALVRHVAINEALVSGYSGIDSTASGATRLIAQQILSQVSRRFISLERLVFISDDRNPVYSSDAVFVEPSWRNRRLEREIWEATGVIGEKQPGFKLPPWIIQTIAAEPDPPVYGQSILGYQGSRSTFFKETWLLGAGDSGFPGRDIDILESLTRDRTWDNLSARLLL
ncbi:hypothetical protein AAE478_003103 [Parahypoxylon ruwenzoriense]